MPDFLFHACKTCMCKILEITTGGNCNKVRKVMNSTCCFMNSQLPAEENCLDKVHFWLNHQIKYGDTLNIVCSQCKPKLCTMITYKELNFLGKSYVIRK